MPRKTLSQLMAENAALQARLVELEKKVADRPCGEGSLQESDSKDSTHIMNELQASEIRYRRLFETAKDGILILDAKTGNITDSNPYLEDLLGYSHAELNGRALWEIGPLKDIAATQSAFQQLQLNDYNRYDNLPLETKGRELRHVEFVSNAYMVNGDRVMQCSIREITARKHADDIVRQANEDLSAMVTELKRWDSEMQLLNHLNDLLHACTSQDEAYKVIALIADELFAGHQGGLAILPSSGQLLELVARWGGDAPVETIFSIDDCWAMRRGQPHSVKGPHASMQCRHFLHQPENGYLCVPLTVVRRDA